MHFLCHFSYQNQVKHMRVCSADSDQHFYLSETKYFKSIVVCFWNFFVNKISFYILAPEEHVLLINLLLVKLTKPNTKIYVVKRFLMFLLTI